VQQILYYGIPIGVVVSVALWMLPAFFRRRPTQPLGGVIAYTLVVQLTLFLFESSFEGTVLRVLFYLSVGLATALLRTVDRDDGTAVSPGSDRASARNHARRPRLAA
jgi:hypothetical protein